jgi:hypothetical protein
MLQVFAYTSTLHRKNKAPLVILSLSRFDTRRWRLRILHNEFEGVQQTSAVLCSQSKQIVYQPTKPGTKIWVSGAGYGNTVTSFRSTRNRQGEYFGKEWIWREEITEDSEVTEASTLPGDVWEPSVRTKVSVCSGLPMSLLFLRGKVLVNHMRSASDQIQMKFLVKALYWELCVSMSQKWVVSRLVWWRDDSVYLFPWWWRYRPTVELSHTAMEAFCDE